MGDVWDVFEIALFEALAVQGSEEFAGSSDALEGGFEEVLGIGLCVDVQGRGIGQVGFEGGGSDWGTDSVCSFYVFSNASDEAITIVTKRWRRTVFGLVNRRNT